MAGGLPATIYRPGIVVGDSATGETQKYDGPYFIATVPRPPAGPRRPRPEGRRSRRRPGLPGAARLRRRRDGRPLGPGRLGGQHLRPHRPGPADGARGRRTRSPVGSASASCGCRCRWARPMLAIDRVPGMERLLGLPAEAVDYFASPTTYATTNTTADLAGTGVRCPPFDGYADRLLDFMRDPPRDRREGDDLTCRGRPCRPDAAPSSNVDLTGPRARTTTRPSASSTARFRLVRVGIAGDVAAAEALVRSWAPHAGAIAVTGIREARAVGRATTASSTPSKSSRPPPTFPVSDGRALDDVLQEWAVRHVQTELPGYFAERPHGRAGRRDHDRTARCCASSPTTSTSPTRSCGSTSPRGWPGNPLVGLSASTGRPAAAPAPGAGTVGPAWRRAPASQHTRSPAAPPATPTCWSRRTTSSWASASRTSPGRPSSAPRSPTSGWPSWGHRGVDLVLDVVPQPFPVTVSRGRARGDDAGARGRRSAHRRRPARHDRGRRAWSRGSSTPTGSGARAASRSSSTRCRRSSSTRWSRSARSRPVAPGVVNDAIEKAVAYAPPFTYSHVTGITSPTGAEAEGWLITVGGTPKELMAHSPEFTYARLLRAADIARKLGAQVMGLGAFTKVVGDAGVTVAKQASLPVTTGNSYSASGALWAAHEADPPARHRRGRRRGQGPRPGDGRRCHGRDRVGVRAAAGARQRRDLAGLARDREAADAQARDRAGAPARHRARRGHARTSTSPTWT